MSLNYVNLVLDLYDGQGNPVTTGNVTLSPNVTVLDSTDHVVITQSPVTVRLFGNPLPSVQIVATDNSGLTPSGWAWLIQPQFPGAPPGEVYEVLFASGATQYLSDLLPATEGPVITTYATAALLAAETTRAEAAEAAAQAAAIAASVPQSVAYVTAPLPSGSDDYAGVSARWSAAMTAGVPFRFGPGRYKLSLPLPAITVNGWVVGGAGKNGALSDEGTLLQALTGASRTNWPQGTGIITTTALTSTIRDLSLDGNGVAFNELAMTHSEGTTRALISGVSCRNNSIGPGLWNVGCEDVTWDKSEISGSEAPSQVGLQSLGGWISSPGGQQSAHGCDFFAPVAVNVTDWTHTGGNAGCVLVCNPAGDGSRHLNISGAWVYDGTGYSGGQVFSPVDAVIGAPADAAMGSGGTTLTTTTAYFTSAMVGNDIAVYPPGAAAPLTGTISAFTSSTQVTTSFTNSGGAFSGAFWWAGGGYLCSAAVRGCRMVAALAADWVRGWLPNNNSVTLDDHTVLAATSLNANNPLIIFRAPSGGDGTDTSCRIGHGGVQVNVSGTPHIQIGSGGSSTRSYEVLGSIGNYPSTLIGQSNLTVAPSVPSSATAFVSPYPVAMTVHLTGGTVSAVSVNGTALSNPYHKFVMQPGSTVTLTYSSAPTWSWSQLVTMPVIDSTSADIAALGSQAAGSTGYAADAGHVHPATGLAVLDSTAADIAATGTQAAGAIGKAADAGHVHFSSGMLLRAPVVYAPGTPANLTTTSATLAAVSSANVNTGSFTAPASGSVIVTASFVMSAGANLIWAFALAEHGGVSPVIGNVVLGEWSSTVSNPNITIPFVVTGLTAASSHNFDLLFAIAGAGTLAVRVNGQTSVTPTGATNAPNGPAVMIVQAV